MSTQLIVYVKILGVFVKSTQKVAFFKDCKRVKTPEMLRSGVFLLFYPCTVVANV
jgi:hypothetical protein